MIKKVEVKIAGRKTRYDVLVGPGLLHSIWPKVTAGAGPRVRKAVLVSNRRVFSLYGDVVQTSLESEGIATAVHLIGDGERFKTLATAENILRAMAGNGLSRSDAVVALGGGVVGDAAGFAASVYLRGLPLFLIPTTLLSMIDSSVGGKTGVNTAFGKNTVGTFYQPSSVTIDPETLRTLPRREITAGLCEAIKQAAVAGGKLFRDTRAFLEQHRAEGIGAESALAELAELIAGHVAFKVKIVRNDEIEQIGSRSPRSRKILNFGHTFAHALEKATDYKYLRHGEAVGHGIRFAASLSKKLELITQIEVEFLDDVLRLAGALPAISHIDPSRILEAFKYDKKRVGDSIDWVLLHGIGKPVIVPGSEIPLAAIRSTLRKVTR